METPTYTTPAYTKPSRGACAEGEHSKDQGRPSERLYGHELSTERYGWLTNTQITLPNHVEEYSWNELRRGLVSWNIGIYVFGSTSTHPEEDGYG